MYYCYATDHVDLSLRPPDVLPLALDGLYNTDLVLGAVESEVDVEWEGGGDGEGEVGHRGHQVHPVWPREVLGTGRAKDKYQIFFREILFWNE